MDKRNFAFDKVNFILLAAGMAVVIIGLILMSGPGSTDTTFNPEIFSTRRIVVAPIVSLFGFLFIIYAILRKPADTASDKANASASDAKAGNEVVSNTTKA